MNKSIISNS